MRAIVAGAVVAAAGAVGCQDATEPGVAPWLTVIDQQADALDDGLVGFWAFETGEGTTATDSSGNGFTMTLVNGPTWEEGPIGGALRFDGDDDFGAAGDVLAFAGTEPFSLAAWVKTSDASPASTHIIAGKFSMATGYGLAITMGSTGPMYRFMMRAGPGDAIAVNVPRPANTDWQHVAATYDGSRSASGLTLYVDGVAQPPTVLLDALTGSIANDVSFQVSGRDGITDVFDGHIDQLRVYDRVLSGAEVVELHERGATSPPDTTDRVPPSIPSDVVGVVFSTSRIDLFWSPATDDVGVADYRIYRDGVFLASTPSTSYADRALTAATAYAYSVSAVDEAGNESPQSNAASVTTSATGPDDTTSPTPLTTMSAGTYHGFTGGLYPDGSNAMPTAHASAGLVQAGAIEPLSPSGSPDPDGKYVLVSFGMSNTTQEWCAEATPESCNAWSFMGQAAGDPAVDDRRLVIINGAKGGEAIDDWESPDSPNYDRIRTDWLEPEALTEAQVQVAWFKNVTAYPTVALPAATADAYTLVQKLGTVLRVLKARYPNLRVVFMSSRIYAGYASTALNPEPFAFETGLAVKWLIQAQIDQMATGRIDPLAGDLDYDTVAPWLAWGPYIWADGTTPNPDGLMWVRDDFADDGTHPSDDGEEKVATRLMTFFKTSPFTVDWFLASSDNAAPVASFTSDCTDLDCTFTDTSSDADGAVAAWEWDFGDGSGAAQQNPTHTYAAAGTYTATLTVTDDDGARSAPVSRDVTVTAENVPPAASFTVTCSDLDCVFTDTSTDADGEVASCSWDFGDGSTSGERNPSHTYGAAGTYTVTMTATDDEGAASAPVTEDLTVSAGNATPVAGFTVSCDGLDCAFTDTSTDADGAVVGWTWDFGDGATSAVQHPSHTFGGAGTYTVTLIATDDEGAASVPATQDVTVSAGNQPPVADFVVTCDAELVCTFDGTGSFDPDGTIVAYEWLRPNGSVWSTAASFTQDFARPGGGDVTLTVTDDAGASTSVVRSVTIPPDEDGAS